VAETDDEPKAPIGTRAARTVKTLRWWMVVPLPLLVIVLQSFGPDGWREPLARLLWLSWICVFVAVAHGFRKALFAYADLGDAWDKAMETPVGAAIVFHAVCLVLAALLLVVTSSAKAQDVRTYIPANAQALLPQLRAVQAAYWPEHPMPSYFGALIEQESCISLTHSRCWNSRAQLKTAREEGAGLGQFTRAYDSAGSLRFDAIAEVRALDPNGLAEFTWASVYQRADLSMRAILVKVRDCYRRSAALVRPRRALLVEVAPEVAGLRQERLRDQPRARRQRAQPAPPEVPRRPRRRPHLKEPPCRSHSTRSKRKPSTPSPRSWASTRRQRRPSASSSRRSWPPSRSSSSPGARSRAPCCRRRRR
jgi:hypothetical protein